MPYNFPSKFKLSSRKKLSKNHIKLFPKDNFMHKLARTICKLELVAAKEFFEAWEVAKQVKPKLSGKRIIDFAGGHGLLAHIFLLLDKKIEQAIIVDKHKPPIATKLEHHLKKAFPSLANKIIYQETTIENFALRPQDLVLAIHACGTLTDQIINKAIAQSCNIAVLPCCHDYDKSETANLNGWIATDCEIDILRALKLKKSGYQIITKQISPQITPMNRLLIGIKAS